MKNSVKKISLIAGGLLVVAFLSILIFNSSHEEVFPKIGNKNYVFGSYHEDIPENNSIVKLDTLNDAFKITYELSRATRNPFIAAFIATKDSVNSLADFHKHNAVRINLKSKIGMRIPVMITLGYPKGAVKENGIAFPLVTLVKYIEYKEPGDYEIRLDEMKIPDWWYRVHRLHREEVDLGKIVRVEGIVIGSCSILREKLEDTITINSIEFYTDNSILYRNTVLVIASILLIVLIVLGFKEK